MTTESQSRPDQDGYTIGPRPKSPLIPRLQPQPQRPADAGGFVACVAMMDPVLGEKMCACVILREDATLTFDDLTTHLQGHEIAKFKLPERFEIFTHFPLSTFGKVSKKDLTRLVAERIREESSGAN